MDQAQELQRAACARCAELAAEYCGFGVIHRHKGADEYDKQATMKKSHAKDAAWLRMLEHLYDPQYQDVHHEKQTHTGWWTKWLKRAHEHISPGYVRRGAIDDPRTADRRFHEHPVRLVSGDGERVVVEELGPRVDVTWLQRHGIPKRGHMAVLRSNNPLEPFWVAEIVSVRGLDEPARAEIARVRAEDAHEQARETAALAAAAAAACASSAATAAEPEPAATAADVASAAKRSARRVARAGDCEYAFSLKSLELTVVWWDLEPKAFGKMHIDVEKSNSKQQKANKVYWQKRFAELGTSLQQLEDELAASCAADKPTRPVWLVETYRTFSFINTEHLTHGKTETLDEQFRAQADAGHQLSVSGSTLVLWGPLAELFNKSCKAPSSRAGKSWKLKDAVYHAVFKDLTQDTRQAPAADAAAEEAKAEAEAEAQAQAEADAAEEVSAAEVPVDDAGSAHDDDDQVVAMDVDEEQLGEGADADADAAAVVDDVESDLAAAAAAAAAPAASAPRHAAASRATTRRQTRGEPTRAPDSAKRRRAQ